jgi:hypothetical protein
MNLVLSFQVEALIARGVSIFNGLNTEIQQLRTPATNITRDLLAEGAGELAVELFGTKARGISRKATKTWLIGEKKKAEKGIINKYYQFYQAWFRDTMAFVSTVSMNNPGITSPGNSHVLQRNIRKAEGYKRLETRIRHVISKLEELRSCDLVLNTTLPKQLEPPKKELYDPSQALHKLEDALRRFIERELSKTGPDWWTKRVSSEIRSKAEGRMHRQEIIWPWHPISSTNMMDYLDFSDYRKIILESANWTQIFVACFKNQSFVDTRMGELEPIRNDVAHSRALPEQGIQKLGLFSKELADCMGTGR